MKNIMMKTLLHVQLHNYVTFYTSIISEGFNKCCHYVHCSTQLENVSTHVVRAQYKCGSEV